MRDERDLDQAFLQRAPYPVPRGGEPTGTRSGCPELCLLPACRCPQGARVALLRYGADGIESCTIGCVT